MMTFAQQTQAASLLKKCLKVRDQMDEGNSVSVEEDDKLTLDIRVFLIKNGAIPDRRKKRK